MFVPERVRVDSLIGTQNTVCISGVKAAEHGRPIFVIRIGDKNYIRDGHHRVMKARLRSQKTIASLVLNLGG